MPKHRGMTLEIFVKAVDSTVMTEYFAKRHSGARMPEQFTTILKEHIDEFLSYPENAQAAGVLDEDFKRINDICQKGKNHVVRAYKHFSIPRNDRTTPETLAMELYINHPKAFDYAFAWYCYYNTPSKLSHHQLPGTISLAADRMEKFRNEIRAWFSDLAKGKECIVSHYKENDSAVILIKHGSYIRTVPYWEGDKVDFHSFRPASEDILVYDKANRVLSIKASLHKDREQYIKSFSGCLMGDESLASRPDRDDVFTLKPLQEGSFNWNGNKDIKRIILTKAKFQLPGATEPVVSISSDNVIKSLEDEDFGFGLDCGELVYARFRFFLEVDGKTKKVSFMITPPDASDHSQKNFAEIIAAYLEEQGVKLI